MSCYGRRHTLGGVGVSYDGAGHQTSVQRPLHHVTQHIVNYNQFDRVNEPAINDRTHYQHGEVSYRLMAQQLVFIRLYTAG